MIEKSQIDNVLPEQVIVSDIQPIVTTSSPTIGNTLVVCQGGQLIGAVDANGNDIFVGSVIQHNDNLFLIKYSKKQKRIVARKEPIKDKVGQASWRDLDWIKRVSPYIKMVGTVLFDDEDLIKRFRTVMYQRM